MLDTYLKEKLDDISSDQKEMRKELSQVGETGRQTQNSLNWHINDETSDVKGLRIYVSERVDFMQKEIHVINKEMSDVKIEVMKNNFIRTGLVVIGTAFIVAIVEAISKKMFP